MRTAFLHFTGPMSTVPQPAVRTRLDDTQIQTQGTIIALVKQYVLMVCVLYCSVCAGSYCCHFWNHCTFFQCKSNSQIWHAVLSQVSQSLIWIAHHSGTRSLDSTSECNCHFCTDVNWRSGSPPGFFPKCQLTKCQFLKFYIALYAYLSYFITYSVGA